MPKDLFLATGGYDECLVGGQDMDLFLRMVEKCEVVGIDEPLYRLRIHSARFSIGKWKKQLRSKLHVLRTFEKIHGTKVPIRTYFRIFATASKRLLFSAWLDQELLYRFQVAQLHRLRGDGISARENYRCVVEKNLFFLPAHWALYRLPIQQDNQRKISLCTADLSGGGAERVLVALANELVRMDWEVNFLLAKLSGELLGELDNRVKVITLGSGGALRAALGLLSYMSTHKNDPLMTTQGNMHLLAIVFKYLIGFKGPLLLREATTPSRLIKENIGVKGRLLRGMLKRLYRFADAVIASSQGVLDELRRDYHLDEQKTFQLNNAAVDPDIDVLMAKGSGIRAFDQKTEDTNLILAVGRLVGAKGFDVLIKAFAEAFKGTKAELYIFGEGPLAAELEQLALSLDIGDRVFLPGFHRNPYALYARADLFVLSSRREGMPNSLIQALACGCPSVATDCDNGPREIIDSPLFGQLVPVDDVREMARAMKVTIKRKPESIAIEQIRYSYSASASAKKLASLIAQLRQDFPQNLSKTPEA